MADEISAKLSGFKKKNKEVLLALSGGSSLGILRYIDRESLGKNLTVGMLDERYDKANAGNNFRQMIGSDFGKAAGESGCKFIDTSVKKGQTRSQLGEYLEKRLKGWRKDNPSGIIIATIGMGSDGHISGMMPFPENEALFDKLFNGVKWAAAYDASGKNPFAERVTSTITFLKQVEIPLSYICGPDKIAAFKKIKSRGPASEYPCRALNQLKKIIIYTDINSK